MKKLSLLIGGLLLSSLTMAQTGEQKGRITVEGQATTAGTVIGSIVAPGVRGRYFVTENLGVRGTFAFSNKSTTNNFFSDETGNLGTKGSYLDKQSAWNLALGAEYHVEGTEKMSPYIAFDVTYGSLVRIIDAENATVDGFKADYSRKTEVPVKRLGAALVGGADYNFSSKFYLGGEIGIQVSNTTVNEGKTTIVSGTTTKDIISNETKIGSSSDLIATVRLGFRF